MASAVLQDAGDLSARKAFADAEHNERGAIVAVHTIAVGAEPIMAPAVLQYAADVIGELAVSDDLSSERVGICWLYLLRTGMPISHLCTGEQRCQDQKQEAASYHGAKVEISSHHYKELRLFAIWSSTR